MIDLTQLERQAGSKEGARPLFQKLVLHLVKLKHRDARDIRPAPGDWGIDVFVGELTSGPCIVWQVKYFPDGLGKAQKQEIRDSFRQVVDQSKKENFNLTVWYLCVPCVLSGPEEKWWEGWRREQIKETKLCIELMCNCDLENMLMAAEAENIRLQFNLGITNLAALQPTIERDIEETPIEKLLEYENSLFIQKLMAAGIEENDSARRQFFNAEIIKKEINGRGDPEEIKQLRSLYEKIRAMWEPRFISAKNSSDPVSETRKVYSDMLLAIEREDKANLISPKLQASFVHKQGFMQQLADDCSVGWSPDYRRLQRKAL